jgi:LacI family transcriptional regulator
VGTNSISGGVLAIKHLTQLGHKRIGFVNGHKEAYISMERLAGYLAALYTHGIQFDQSLCFDGDYSMESGEKAANYFAETDVTAIYFASDLMALGAIRRFKELGFNLPQDISIVGFDNQSLCQGCTPTLTTIAQDPVALGETACALLRGLTQNTPVSRAQLEPWLEVRESTASPKS